MCAEAHVGHSAAAMRSGAGRRSCVRGRGGVAAARGVRGMREGQRVDSPFLWLQRVDRGQALPRLPVLSNRNQRCACILVALALRNAESTFPQTQVLALRNAHSKAGRTSARFTKPRDTAFANSSDGDCHVTIILSANIYWGAGLQPFCYATEVVQRIIINHGEQQHVCKWRFVGLRVRMPKQSLTRA